MEALRRCPNDERAQWGYAEVLWERDHQAEAVEHMTKAVALSGSNPDLLVRLGQMHLELGDFTRAGENADAALRSRRADPTAWALKADIYRGVGRTEEAIDCYQRAMVYRRTGPKCK